MEDWPEGIPIHLTCESTDIMELASVDVADVNLWDRIPVCSEQVRRRGALEVQCWRSLILVFNLVVQTSLVDAS